MKILHTVAIAVVVIGVPLAYAATTITTLAIKDGGGVSRNMAVLDQSGAGTGPYIPLSTPSDITGAPYTSSNPLPVSGSYDSGPITVTATPANSSHAAGSSVGGLFTIGLARTSGATGQLNSLLFKDSNNTAESYVVRVWSRNPSSTTCTDGSAFVSNTTDDGYLMGTGPTPITTAAPNVTTGDSNVYASLASLAWSYATNGNANIYVCVITVNTYTPGSTKPFYITASGPQN